jgi:hypothetical protein
LVNDIAELFAKFGCNFFHTAIALNRRLKAINRHFFVAQKRDSKRRENIAPLQRRAIYRRIRAKRVNQKAVKQTNVTCSFGRLLHVFKKNF